MLKVSGFGALERYGKRLATLPKQWPKAQASAVNKAAAEVKKKTKAETVARTRLPAGPVGRRIWVKRADARKPTQWARVTAGQNKFSASYMKVKKKVRTKDLMARRVGKGVKLGMRSFPGAWIGKGKHRQFVGKRTGKSAYPIVYPHVNIGPIIGKSVKRNGVKIGGKVMESELGKQVEKRLRKHMVGF